MTRTSAPRTRPRPRPAKTASRATVGSRAGNVGTPSEASGRRPAMRSYAAAAGSLVEVPCHDGPVTQTRRAPPRRARSRSGARRPRCTLTTVTGGRPGPSPASETVAAAYPRVRSGKRTRRRPAAHVVDDDPRRGQDRRPAGAETATVPEQATGAGERREPELGREPARHLLQAQHVGPHGAHHPGGGRAVVRQVVHVVRHDPQHVLRSRRAHGSAAGARQLGGADEAGVAAEHGPHDARLGAVAAAGAAGVGRPRGPGR